MKIGILGGTFDPIHNAHISMGELALSYFKLDKVLFMPAKTPYFKTGIRDVTLPVHRANMIKCAVKDNEFFECSEIEFEREGYTYTADTLKKLLSENPDNEYFLILGADSFATIDTWYKPKEIFKSVNIVVAYRNSQISERALMRKVKKLRFRYNAQIRLLNWDGDTSSSTIIREKLSRCDYNVSVPKSVIEYVKKMGLYENSPSLEQIKNRLEAELTPHRFAHSISVANTAFDLALCHGYKEPEKAYFAGMIHDCGKPYADALSHAAVGADIAKRYYHVDDEEILSAIASHTIGSTNMSMLDKIIFLADFIEPLRENIPGLEYVKNLSYIDMNKAILRSIECTREYLLSRDRSIDEESTKVYNYFKTL